MTRLLLILTSLFALLCLVVGLLVPAIHDDFSNLQLRRRVQQAMLGGQLHHVVVRADGALYPEEGAVARLRLVVVAVVFGSLLARIVVVSEQTVELRSLYFENALDVVEEVGQLVVVVFPQQDLDSFDLGEVLFDHELLDLVLGLYKENLNQRSLWD